LTVLVSMTGLIPTVSRVFGFVFISDVLAMHKIKAWRNSSVSSSNFVQIWQALNGWTECSSLSSQCRSSCRPKVDVLRELLPRNQDAGVLKKWRKCDWRNAAMTRFYTDNENRVCQARPGTFWRWTFERETHQLPFAPRPTNIMALNHTSRFICRSCRDGFRQQQTLLSRHFSTTRSLRKG